MGDRCYLVIKICGHIGTVTALEEIVSAVLECGLHDVEGDGGSETEIREAFGDAIGGINPSFHDFECNYANITPLEAVLQLHGVGYAATHDAGDDYPAGCFAFHPGDGRYEEEGSDPVISIDSLRKAMKERRKIDAIKALILDAEKAAGKGLPPYSVSEEVRLHLRGE